MRGLLALLLLCCAAPAVPSATVDSQLSRDPSLLALYQSRNFAPLWFANGTLTTAGAAALVELATAEKRGLRSSDYEPRTGEQHGVIDRDVALSVAVARLAMDLHAGRVNPRHLGHDLDVGHARADAGLFVKNLAEAQDVSAALDALEPNLAQYRRLKSALAAYRVLSTDPALTRLPPLPKRTLEPGEQYAGAADLRRLLRAVGDLPAPPLASAMTENPIFDAELSQGLRRFQARHGLAVDGRLGPTTFRELTTPFVRRISQITLSLERARWLPKFNVPPIIVNVPQFRLFAFRTTQDNTPGILQMDVVVGEAFPGRRTPVFGAEMRYLVLRPYWDVPYSILLGELLPSIRRDPSWVKRNDYEIVKGQGDDAQPQPATADNVRLLARGTLRLRQKPGPANALGLVKFMLPNSHNVYLHDTPARSLFREPRRAFSHGCIRVANPMALIHHVLGVHPDWPEERIVAAMQSNGPVRIALPRPIPVFVLYGTALVRGTGEVLFFEDLYGHDMRLEAAMRSPQD